MIAISNWRRRAVGILGVALLGAGALPLEAAELVMFDRAGCIWCARWDREVAPVYARTPEGRIAPLRRIDVESGAGPQPGLASPVRFTPTFVLLDEGREIGRITGYVGDDAFWGLLGKLLAGMEKPIRRIGGHAATMD